ncbi:RNA polymerase sigma-70 factor (ECF subfamily) [Mucilaginibacter gracilis]|uniref:RNA polymerase sigma-70 factor (ECF subfamily) n=1 Tax=Mucilaginibacter gracilis TaxID=423350 RepID=A0A495J507_9SPHI|nr:RNA polymerase sigma-70 factor [Mucilaginibacter gracilis]RKR84060.1 RNA polymerase sigma-70 factor (ECF subfamily) [Mucilaginibacter gracilis]
MPPEKELLIALKAGDESAFKAVFDLYFKRMFAFCYKMLKNREQAEEVVNDTFLSVWTNRHKLNIEFPIAPYLYTINRRLTLNALRQIATSQKAINELWLTIEKISNDTEESILLNDLQRFTDEALQILSPQQQIVFKMSRYEHLNYDEIAEKLNLSRNTVKNHLIAALKTLRNYFSQSDLNFFILISAIVLKK